MGSKSSTTTSKTIYGKTTTTNPYAVANTNNKGTTTKFQDGTAFESIYNFANDNINSLLDNLINPSLNSPLNQSKLNTFAKELGRQSALNFENNIVNPLSKRNMIRSSQASDLYKNMYNQNAASVDNYISSLINDSQTNTAKVLSALLSYYMQGYSVISNTQDQSLKTSSGNAKRINNTTTGSDISSQIASIIPIIAAAAMAL